MNIEQRELRTNQVCEIFNKIPDWERIAMKHALETHIGNGSTNLVDALRKLDDKQFDIFWSDISDNYGRQEIKDDRSN
jgi:hypothetical protein